MELVNLAIVSFKYFFEIWLSVMQQHGIVLCLIFGFLGCVLYFSGEIIRGRYTTLVAEGKLVKPFYRPLSFAFSISGICVLITAALILGILDAYGPFVRMIFG